MAKTFLPPMDVSYSVWREVAAERETVSGESFSFLFDRRYTNRLNRMSRVFFEAYARATREVAAEEDRFPSLSEIESRMDSGAIYAYKDRLMRSTGFFEEVKISGISYLIPKARRFVDETGTYTDLILDLENGEVVLPKRDKPSAGPRTEEPGPEGDETEDEEYDLKGGSEGLVEGEPPAPPAGSDVGGRQEPGRPTAPSAEVGGELRGEEEAYDAEDERRPPGAEEAGAKEEARPQPVAPPEEPPLEPEEKKAKGAMGAEIPTEETSEAAEDETEPVAFVEMEKPEEIFGPQASGVERVPPSDKTPPPAFQPSTPPKRPEKGSGGWWRDKKALVIAGIGLLLIVAGFYLWPSEAPEPPAIPPPPSDFVSYSAYLTNASGNSYLNLDITNPKGLESKVELVLPPDVDKSISATGGIVTIYYTNNTVIQLVSSNNASVSVALTDEYILVPVTFNLAIPEGYESSVLVYDKDYRVSRTNSTINLWSNTTADPLEFDQIYNAKRASGGPGTEERGPENATAGPPTGPPGPQT
jgi:hypothetical protein